MKKNALLAVALVVGRFIPSQSQSEGTKTYFDEIHEFKVEYPEGWIMGAADEKKAAAMVSFSTQDGDGVLISTTMTAYANSKDYSGRKSVIQKDAKKAKDAHFKILNEGKTKSSKNTDVLYMEYTHTVTIEGSDPFFQTIRDYHMMHKRKGSFYGDHLLIRCYARDEHWQDMLPLFEKIFKSLEFTGEK